MKSAAVVAVVVGGLMLIVGTWWLTREDAPPAITVAEPTPPTQSAERVDDSPAANVPNPTVATESTRVPTPIAAAPATEPDAAGDWRIQCIDDASGEPCPSARVWCITDPRMLLAPNSREQRMVADVPAALANTAASGVADANGVATIPRETQCFLVATLGDRVGLAVILRPIDSATIRLARASSLDVEVVRADGKPASGIDLVLSKLAMSDLTVDRRAPPVASRTDANGRASFAHVPAWRVVANVAGPRGATLRVTPALLCGDRVALDVPDDLDSSPPLRIALPATGDLLVRVVDESGAPVRRGGTVSLWPMEASDDPDAQARETTNRLQRSSAGWETQVARAPIVDGMAHFVDVPIEVDLGVGVTLESWAGSIPARACRASLSAGDEASFDFVVEKPADALTLRGRFVDVEGRPAASASLIGIPDLEMFARRKWRIEGLKVKTDADGRFELVFDRAPKWQSLEWVRSNPGLPGTMVPEVAPMPWPPARTSGIVDVGDIAFRARPRILSGRVVTADGAGVLAKLVIDGDTPIHLHTLDDGTFDVYGAEPSASLTVTAMSQGGSAGPRTVQRGETDVVLTLAETLRVHGRVLVDNVLEISELVVAYWSNPGTPSESPTYCAVAADGAFSFEATPGSHALIVSAARDGLMLRFLEQLDVSADGSTRPPIDSIDLRGLCVRIRARVVDADDRPLKGFTVEGRPQGMPFDCEPDGSFSILAMSPSVEVVLRGIPGQPVIKRTIRDGDVIRIERR
jgi:hypothetical protein